MTNQYDDETKQIIADLDKQAKEIQAKIDELKSGPKNKNVRWRAEGKNRFFYLNFNSGSIIESEDSGWANLNYQTGNYFKTKEEAEQYKNNLIITQKLKDIALRLNNGEKIDCNDYCDLLRPKYKIVLKPYEHKLIQAISTSTIDLSQIYCLSDKFLETCIKEIGEKELIEYIKGC